MSFSHDYSEDGLVEKPAIEHLVTLGWDYIDCMNESFPSNGYSVLGRTSRRDVVLTERLRSSISKLNPELPPNAIDLAVEELSKDRLNSLLVNANQEIHTILCEGVNIKYKNFENETVSDDVKIIDWNNYDNNDFLLTSQLWVTGEMYTRRCDLVGFVNGLPLVFIELKNTHRNVRDAYDENLRDYKNTVPQLFCYNATIILSNGSQSKIGTITSSWEHFSDWKKVSDEKETAKVSLERMLDGTCDPQKLLDIIENFTIFSEIRSNKAKIVAKNHQYLGVNAAIERIKSGESLNGKLGVFWHTQGSGKSISMVFFSSKILRKIPGNWSFVIVTDRTELDEQIYKNFASTGAIIESECQATSADDLRKLLSGNHRFIFTLIQKFRTPESGQIYEKVSDRNDIIVMVDEAHRTQYDTFALNMRNAMPKAQFMAFTGTPLISGEEKTRDVFGDYISIYDFKQSIDDDATVPLYYENRIPELQLETDDLNEQVYRIVEDADLDENQQIKLEREFARQYHLITRESRLDQIAEDLVDHFVGRGYRGKAMFIAIDRPTAIKMYDKVQKCWENRILDLEDEYSMANDQEKISLRERLDFLKETDMAVVVSQSQNEVEDMLEKGLDIIPHRKRMNEEDLDIKFKDVNSNFRLVFLCSMWMTGFDVPNCSTIYIDKPLKNHTLMQTIARANRVYEGKLNGLVVDYIGVFRNLNKALAIYATGRADKFTPIESKNELLKILATSIQKAEVFLSEKSIDIQKILEASGFEKIRLLDDAVENILETDETKNKFNYHVNTILKVWKAILPDRSASNFTPKCVTLKVISKKIKSLNPRVDISSVHDEINDQLDAAIASEGYVIEGNPEENLIDISTIDFENLANNFKSGRKRTELEKIRSFVSRKISRLVKLNRTRLNYTHRFQGLIDQYNEGALNVQAFFEILVQLVDELEDEEKRSLSEGLSEEELAVFDILCTPSPELTDKQISQVKKVAKELVKKINERDIIVLDWRKKPYTRALVETTVKDVLEELPEEYEKIIWNQKCSDIFNHIFENYYDNKTSTYQLFV